ncbi:hypothetical protein L7750_04740 [Xenorhabdus bovienii]|uniref:hypothetical protein n=1 Tax=Xenorhabdus bovienii TaxID=40576 RepID=UPI001EDE22C9|nr:hypothetical protein [Xenorhabdus bovienii]MCG3469727.1 hypothetical protein [Xenorhabdus bovienii]
MKKIKWMLLNVSLSITDMVDKLKSSSYTDEKGKGFIFNKVRHNELVGRFVEKLTFEEVIPSLYGEVATFERVEYRIVEFYINENTLPVIAIINPPRTLKPFALNLVKILGLGVSLDEINIEPMVWVESISKLTPLELTQIELSQIKVNECALAKMQISSSKDLRSYYEKTFSDKSTSRVDKVHLFMISPNYPGKVKISRTGLVVIDTKHEKDMTDLLFRSLLETYVKI